MTDALEDHEDAVSIGGRTITNFRFADDMGGCAAEEEVTIERRENTAVSAAVPFPTVCVCYVSNEDSLLSRNVLGDMSQHWLTLNTDCTFTGNTKCSS